MLRLSINMNLGDINFCIISENKEMKPVALKFCSQHDSKVKKKKRFKSSQNKFNIHQQLKIFL